MSNAPMHAEPCLALWCHANPDLAAAEIERLRNQIDSLEDASDKVSIAAYLETARELRDAKAEIEQLRKEAEHQSELDAFRVLGLHNEIERLRGVLKRLVDYADGVEGAADGDEALDEARAALALSQAQKGTNND